MAPVPLTMGRGHLFFVRRKPAVWASGGPAKMAKMAATNKCLARSNKSRTGVPATKKAQRIQK
jgi:hypothetical protein